MVNYRRHRPDTGTFFLTTALKNRSSTLLVREVDALRSACQAALREAPARVAAMVVLPEHLHLLLTMPSPADYPKFMRCMKTRFTKQAGRKGATWQPRYWAHTIRDDRDFWLHADYIHRNPVKHGLVQRVRDWPHSTFHDWVARGLLPADWGDAW